MDAMKSDETAVHDNPHDEAVTNGEATALRGLRENARLATDALSDVGHKASVVMKELGDGVYQAGSRTGASVARQVEAQPVAAVMLVAASLGLIIGVLLPRR